MQAILRAAFTGKFVILEYRAFVKASELTGRNGDSRLADHMIKQEETQFQILEIDLITNQLGIGII
jgi:hypothetical protein